MTTSPSRIQRAQRHLRRRSARSSAHSRAIPLILEQVEVVKGPGSAFTGRGSTGGSINLVSKSPSLNRLFGGTFNLGTDGTKRVSADVNVPLSFLGEHTAFRLNLLAHDSGSRRS